MKPRSFSTAPTVKHPCLCRGTPPDFLLSLLFLLELAELHAFLKISSCGSLILFINQCQKRRGCSEHSVNSAPDLKRHCKGNFQKLTIIPLFWFTGVISAKRRGKDRFTHWILASWLASEMKYQASVKKYSLGSHVLYFLRLEKQICHSSNRPQNERSWANLKLHVSHSTRGWSNNLCLLNKGL